MNIGYFASEKYLHRRGRVHAVDVNFRPICGTKVSSAFQWCAWNAIEYVECSKCKKILEKETQPSQTAA